MKRRLLFAITLALMFPLWAASPVAATGQSARQQCGNCKSPSAIKFTKKILTGDGTTTNPYIITSVEDFISMSSISTLNKTFQLTNDLDFSAKDTTAYLTLFEGIFDGNGHKISNVKITSDNRYASLFGYATAESVIKNLTIDNATVISTSTCVGAIAGISDGKIENCKVSNSSVNGAIAAGALVGIATNVSSCIVENSNVECKGGYVGGLAGEIEVSITDSYATGITVKAGGAGAPAGILTGQLFKAKASRCYAEGTLDAGFSWQHSSMSAGGIAGIAFMSTIEECFAIANIKSFDNEACSGALVGAAKGSTITDCFSVGDVQNISSKKTGGLIGWLRSAIDDDNTETLSNVERCWTATTLVAKTADYNPTTEYREIIGVADLQGIKKINYLYFDNQIFNLRSNQYGVATSLLTSATGPEGFNSEKWQYAKGLYPTLKSLSASAAARVATSAIISSADNSLNKISHATPIVLSQGVKSYILSGSELGSEGTNAYIQNDSLMLKQGAFGTEIIVFDCEGLQLRRTVHTCPFVFEGEGTQGNPYILSTAQDLINLSEASTVSCVDFTDTYFIFGNDINLALSDKFMGLGNSKTNNKNKFNGVIDGNGYTLRGLYMKGGEKTASGASQLTTYYSASFVGRLDAAGIVKNLSIAADSHIEGYSYVGAFVGNCEGEIINCRNYADVVGYSCYVGGICGSLAKTGSIIDCFNSGNITTGYHSVGGITGDCNGLIENCANTGAISAIEISLFGNTSLKVAGGISGANSGARLVDCFNAGSVTAGLTNAGGIAGALPKATTQKAGLNDVVRAINIGTTFCPDKQTIGAIAGQNGTTGEIQLAIWDNQLLPIKPIANSDMEGMTGYSTQSLLTADTLPGFSTQRWSFAKGRYPIPTLFANEPSVIAAANTVIYFLDGTDAGDVKTDARLSQQNGLAWSLANATQFKIEEGHTLKGVPTPASFVVDTLIASWQSYNKRILLSSLPSNPLSGQGTKEMPYLINSASEWIALEDYMRNTSTPLTEKYIRITSNLDFANLKPLAFGADGITPFDAVIDGCNHTLSNITINGATAPYTGLFAQTGTASKILNLQLDSTCSISGKGNIGSIVGLLKGEIRNCSSAAIVTSTAANSGGIVGSAEAGSVLSNLSFSGKLSSTGSYTGGIVGIIKGTAAAPVIVDSVDNSGAISASNTYIAGIIGSATYCTISNANNSSTITHAKNGAAGIVAYAIDDVKVKNAFNTASISALSYAAGIVGYATKTPDLYRCINSGDIKTTTYEAAGLVGHATAATINQSANLGNVINTKAALAATSTYGGAAGLVARGNITASDVYNTGEIAASNNLGAFNGIYGSTSAVSTISHAYTVAPVTPYEATASTLNIGVYHGRVASGKEPQYTDIAYDSQHLTEYSHATTAHTTSALIAHAFGNEWISPADYCYPVMQWSAQRQDVLLHSAAIVLAEGNTRDNVTSSFYVGTPEGVQWSGDNVFTIVGNKVKVKAGSQGIFNLTAKCGNFTRNIPLRLNVGTSVDIIDTENQVDPIYYDMQGRRVSNPEAGLYIRIQNGKSEKIVIPATH